MAARDSYGRLLALLAASTSDLAAAQEALADAFERALRTRPAQGVPGNTVLGFTAEQAGLALLDELLGEAGQHARRFQPARATRAHLLDQLGRWQEAVAAYESAISLTHDIAERQYLEDRRDRAGRQDRQSPLLAGGDHKQDDDQREDHHEPCLQLR